MQAELALPARARIGAGPRPETVVGFRTAVKAARSGVLWGYVFGLTAASSALGFASTYKTAGQRATLATAFGSNAGIAALNGPARSIQSVAGYTAWKSGAFLTVLGAVLGILTSTRLLRGEEDAGRWELLLAGRTTKRKAVVEALGGLAAGLVMWWMVTAAIIVFAGRSSKVHIAAPRAMFFSLSLVCGATMFLAAGALTSQLAATRRQAASYAGGLLGVAYALRMIADSGVGLTWLRWVSPLGWVEEMRPLTGSRPLPLLLVGVLTIVLCLAAVHLAGARDLGASTLPDRPTAKPRTALLGGTSRFAWRLARPTATAWAVAIAATAFLMGIVSKQAGNALAASSSIQKVLARLGAAGAGALDYLGIAFLIVAVVLGIEAAGIVSATRVEESAGRLENLLVRPVSRTAWLAGRALVGVAVVVAGGVLAGVVAWAAAATQDAGVGFWRVMAAGINVVPPSLCILGTGALALGIWPRASSPAAYSVLVWSFAIELVGGVAGGSNHWLLDTSVYHQMAAAPAVQPDWASAGALSAIGVLGTVVGMLFLQRRDLVGD